MSRFSCGRLRGFGRPRLLESCRSLSRNLADHRVAGPSPLNRENRANNGSHGGEPETEQTAADREETQRKTRKKRRGNQLEIPLSHGKPAYPRGIQRFVRTTSHEITLKHVTASVIPRPRVQPHDPSRPRPHSTTSSSIYERRSSCKRLSRSRFFRAPCAKRKAIAPLSTPKFRKVESVIVSTGAPDPFAAFPLISVDFWKGICESWTVKGAGLGNVRLVRIGGEESNGIPLGFPTAL